MIEILKRLLGEDIVVSTTAIGPTVATIPVGTIMASFNNREGGIINWNIDATPVAGGTFGDIGQVSNSKWNIWGKDNLIGMKMVKQTGESDSTVAVQYFGEGVT